MKYITGIHALNLPCKLNTTGDWHASAIQWDSPNIKESNDSIFGDWGIEANHIVSNQTRKCFVANHIRACLDMLDDGQFSYLQGMKNDYICCEEYTPLIFDKVKSLRRSSLWNKINQFMEHEYKMQWIHFREAI